MAHLRSEERNEGIENRSQFKLAALNTDFLFNAFPMSYDTTKRIFGSFRPG